MVRVDKRDFVFIQAGADHQRLVPHRPVGVGVLVAVGDVAQVVNVIEIPVFCISSARGTLSKTELKLGSASSSLHRGERSLTSGNVIERVILHHKIHDVRDLVAEARPY